MILWPLGQKLELIKQIQLGMSILIINIICNAKHLLWGDPILSIGNIEKIDKEHNQPLLMAWKKENRVICYLLTQDDIGRWLIIELFSPNTDDGIKRIIKATSKNGFDIEKIKQL